ncbi:MAG: hypothetical protein GX829_04725, partial [Clostridium sp.]|nr:hypothetical protein [Clostridium sp.]
MRIEGSPNINPIKDINGSVNDTALVIKEIKIAQPEDFEAQDKFEKSSVVNISQIYDLLSIKGISKEPESILGQLKKLIVDLLMKHSEVIELVKNIDDSNDNQNQESRVKLINVQLGKMRERGIKTESFQIDKAMTSGSSKSLQAEFSKVKSTLLASDLLDVEISSEEVVVFLKNISNEGKANLSTLAKEVMEMFNEIEKNSGKLPPVSKRTFQRIMEKLDQLMIIQKHRNEPVNIKIELIKMIKETIQEQAKAHESLHRGKNEQGSESKLANELKSGNEAKLRSELKLGSESKLGNESKLSSESKIGNGKALLLLQGRLGIKESSERILFFIREASEGDQTKLLYLVKEMSKTFKEQESEIFKLPEISIKTYEKIRNELFR